AEVIETDVWLVIPAHSVRRLPDLAGDLAQPRRKSRPLRGNLRSCRKGIGFVQARDDPFSAVFKARGVELVALDLGTRPRFLLLLGCEGFAEILGREDTANLDLGFARHRVWTPLDPRDGFLHRLHLPEPVARDELLGLGEWTIDHGAVLPRKPHAHAPGARM